MSFINWEKQIQVGVKESERTHGRTNVNCRLFKPIVKTDLVKEMSKKQTRKKMKI